MGEEGRACRGNVGDCAHIVINKQSGHSEDQTQENVQREETESVMSLEKVLGPLPRPTKRSQNVGVGWGSVGVSLDCQT